jgi:hypothetical protein
MRGRLDNNFQFSDKNQDMGTKQNVHLVIDGSKVDLLLKTPDNAFPSSDNFGAEIRSEEVSLKERL